MYIYNTPSVQQQNIYNQPVHPVYQQQYVQNYQTVPGYYYAANPVQNAAFSPVAGLYTNAVNPNLPVSHTFLGVEKTPYGDSIYLYKTAKRWR